MSNPLPVSLQKHFWQLLNSYMDCSATDNDEMTFGQARQLLIDRINLLLDHDYEKLLWLMYRIDVNESKAKSTLAANPGQPPAEVIADLIIERLLQKAKSRADHPASSDWKE